MVSSANFRRFMLISREMGRGGEREGERDTERERQRQIEREMETELPSYRF